MKFWRSWFENFVQNTYDRSRLNFVNYEERIGYAKHPGCPKTNRSNINIEAMNESISGSPRILLRGRGQELQISRRSVQLILSGHLRSHAYRIQ